MSDFVFKASMEDAATLKSLEDIQKATADLNRQTAESERLTKAEAKSARETAAARRQQADAEKELAKARASVSRHHESMGDAGARGLVQANVDRQLQQLARMKAELDAGAWESKQRSALARESREMADLDGGAAAPGWLKGLAGLAGGASVAGIISEFVNAVDAASDRLNAMGDVQEASARSLRDFRSINPGDDGRAFVERAVKMGATLGLSPGEVGDIGATIQASVDRDGTKGISKEEEAKFDEGMRVAASLINLGVEAGDAQKVIAGAPGRGLSATRLSTIFMTAAEESTSMTPRDMAKVMSATANFSSAEMGFAAATAISEEERDPGRVPEKVRAAQRALGPGADSSKFTRKLNLSGLSEVERIDAIAEYFSRTGDQSLGEDERIAAGSKTLTDSKKFGLDFEEAQGIAMLVRQRQMFRKTLDMMQGQNAAMDLAGERATGLMDDPNVRSEFEGRRTNAALGVDLLYGKAGERARRENQRRRDEGEVLREAGALQAVDPGTGESTIGFWGRALNAVAFNAAEVWGGEKSRDNPFTFSREGAAIVGPSARAAETPPFLPAGYAEQIARLNSNLESLNAQLQQNTRATAENTTAPAASGGGMPRVNRNGGL